MKTNLFFQKNIVLFSITGLLCFLVVACSPYQNSLYYDNDGIYGATTDNYTQKVAAADTNNQYKEYFSSMQNDIKPAEIFTNVDNYSSYNKSGDSIAKSGTGYPAWGSNAKDISVNVYPDTWGLYGLEYGYPYYGGFGYGWNYPYYGGFGYGYGWNYPYYGGFGYGYGWSYPSYYPYYDRSYYRYGHYNNNYSYSSGRRGDMSNNEVNRSSNYSNSRNADYSTGGRRSYENNSPNIMGNSNNNSVYSTTRRYQSLGTQSSTYSPAQTNQSYNPQNTYTPTRRDYNSSTTRSYDYSPSRSGYDGGGGMSGGGGGGGRSYSSGRR